MRNIYLIGHMASGKTTVGQLLAQTLNLDFVDTDSNIEYLFSKPINEIFTKEGESQFRIFETAVLLQTTLISNTVISTGGGILTRMRNGLYMKDFGFVIYLELDIKHQAQRLLADDQLSKRPIVRDCKNIEDLIKKLEDLHEKRDLTYEYFADYTIKVGGKTPEEIVNQIINFLNENKIIHEKDFLENFAGRMHYNPYKRLRRNKQIQKLRQEERGAGKKQEYRFIDNE